MPTQRLLRGSDPGPRRSLPPPQQASAPGESAWWTEDRGLSVPVCSLPGGREADRPLRGPGVGGGERWHPSASGRLSLSPAHSWLLSPSSTTTTTSLPPHCLCCVVSAQHPQLSTGTHSPRPPARQSRPSTLTSQRPLPSCYPSSLPAPLSLEEPNRPWSPIL